MITVEHLTKRYGAVTSVDDVSFHCRPGTVTGFLGPNGAGKTTTMRMICSLTPPESGTATINGVPYRDLANPGRHVGVLLDASAQHNGRTGRETLAVSGRLLGIGPTRIDEILQLVGLAGAPAKRRVRHYSLGMRQRLGLAHALLGDPSVLILDEPANGLDPEGIYWMRSLLREFADRGGTVLLSSHLLREVEAVADHVVVIGDGRIVADGDKGEMLMQGGLIVRALEPDLLEGALADAGVAAQRTPDGAFAVDADAETVGRIAATEGVVLLELRSADAAGLEELFLRLTSRGASSGEPLGENLVSAGRATTRGDAA